MKIIAVIDYSIDWTEEFDSEQEAIETLRGLVEADKRYSFAGLTNWRWATRGDNTVQTKQIKWVYIGEDGQIHSFSKTLRNTIKYSDVHGTRAERRAKSKMEQKVREERWDRFYKCMDILRDDRLLIEWNGIEDIEEYLTRMGVEVTAEIAKILH